MKGGRVYLVLYDGALVGHGGVQGGQGLLRQCGDGFVLVAGVVHVT